MIDPGEPRGTDEAPANDAASIEGHRHAAVRIDDGTDDLGMRRKRRAQALCMEVEQRFTTMAAASPRSLAVRSQSDHYGRLTATLSWRDPEPLRELTIYVNPMEGKLEWSWVVGRVLKTTKRIDALLFQRTQFDELLALISDQEAWSQRTLPV